MGRGGRSGIGVATFEDGGFVVDAGHPTARFTTRPPDEGDWTVPPVVARHDLPDDWRFLVVVPDVAPGRSGESEERVCVRSSNAQTLPSRTNSPASSPENCCQQPRPADSRPSGEAIAEIGRKNGAWYADAQGGVFRPPAGELVEALEDCPVLSGIGQSSWGPVVYGVTDRNHGDEAVSAAEDALSARGLEGEVLLSQAATSGATIRGGDAEP